MVRGMGSGADDGVTAGSSRAASRCRADDSDSSRPAEPGSQPPSGLADHRAWEGKGQGGAVGREVGLGWKQEGRRTKSWDQVKSK